MTKDFAVLMSMPLPTGLRCIAEAAAPSDADEFFLRLKAALLPWRRSAGSGEPFLSVFVRVGSKDRAYIDILDEVCQRWDHDAELQSMGHTRIEIALTVRGDCWIGCCNSDNVYDPSSPLRGMQFRDYAKMIAEVEAKAREWEEGERARRRANPIASPVPLPKDIASQIARYLRLEFGENARAKESVKARDLVFEGEFVVDGVPTQYWRFPTSDAKKPGWATVERFDDTYSIGMTYERPANVTNS